MTRKYILILFLIVGTTSFAQKTLSDYSFVIVPEQFEFLEGKDKYQLSSLTEFLFNKYGFHAFLTSKAPNVKRCDGLYATIKEDNSFFRTKLTIKLADCNGNVVYSSKEGSSKFKVYKKAYQDATRKAFESIEALDVQQKDVEIVAVEKTTGPERTTEPEAVTKAEAVTEVKPDSDTDQVETEVKNKVEKAIKKQPIIKNTALSNLPAAKFSSYEKGEKSYLLRKTDKGYSLYEESAKAANGLKLTGTITVTNSEATFTNSKNETYDVYFDANRNLSLFKGDQVILYTLVP